MAQRFLVSGVNSWDIGMVYRRLGVAMMFISSCGSFVRHGGPSGLQEYMKIRTLPENFKT